MRRVSTILATAAALVLPAAASAAPYVPPPGKVFAGVTGGESAQGFDGQVGHRSPVFQTFVTFGYKAEFAFTRAQATGARPMLHLSTIAAGGRVVTTPGAIARGGSDGYLLWLNGRMADVGGPVYVRLLAEMNNYRNPYAAFDGSGRARDRDHTTAAFRAAWRRVATILRGGDVASIDARLARLRLPAVRTSAVVLPRPQVALMWVPQVAGAPDTAANAPAAYWPGRAYVDWVGTDFYSKFPNFTGLERFASGRAWRGLPFVFGEWAIWGADDPGFVHRLFAWARSHRQVRMLAYNQGNQADGPFRLYRYPRARAALRAELARPAFR